MSESGATPCLLAVAAHGLAVGVAGGVLAAHDVGRPQRPARHERLAALVAHRLGVERRGRLHRHEAQHLQHVVLDDVAQRAGLLVEAAAPLDADRLGHRDLDVVDEVAVPDRLEDAVREAEHEDVLDGLLAQVVVDPEDLALLERAVHLGVQLARSSQVVAERLLDHDPAEALAASRSRGPRRRARRRSPGTGWAAPTGRTARCRRCRGWPRPRRGASAARRRWRRRRTCR